MTLDVRFGVSPIAWSNDDMPELGGDTPLETALAEGAEIGFAGFELGNKFPRDPAALQAAAGAVRPRPASAAGTRGRLARRATSRPRSPPLRPHLDC